MTNRCYYCNSRCRETEGVRFLRRQGRTWPVCEGCACEEDLVGSDDDETGDDFVERIVDLWEQCYEGL